MKEWEYFSAIIVCLNPIDRMSLIIEMHRRLVKHDLNYIFNRIPKRYYLAPLQIFIFFGYILLMGIDASQSWPVLFSIYGASLSAAVSVWALVRLNCLRANN